MEKIYEEGNLGTITYIQFSFWEKWLIFWRLLKTKSIQEDYTFLEILEDGF